MRDVDGTWRDLTESVNEMAGNLTRQVRAIARVATAVTRGDLNLKIDVDASGEIQELQDYINKMIANLRDTTIANKEQDWLKGNLARISALMQGRRDLEDVASLIMSELTPVVSAQHGAFFLAMPPVDGKDLGAEGEDAYELRMLGSYGYSMGSMPTSFRPGEALIGTAAEEKRTILVENAPQRLPEDLLRPRRGAARAGDRPSGAVRGQGARRHRAGLLHARSRRSRRTSSTRSPR